ncbi:hypothetical protein DL546_004251 [Coniochaeta pulveracea]|uniref:Cytochrome b561 domain-containing protein n=1 Tax=Coniochaeta pulveracea TaxID=177199 RepID=A0A420Y0X0_9PEZI|nr:hypothetical protein DL546_004251 [Coniochaeta pulveracea]
MHNGDFRVVGTCKGCRVWPTGRMVTNSTTSPFILGFGSPTNTLASNDPTVRLKRHEGYGKLGLRVARRERLTDHTGRFTMNTIQATGVNGLSALAALPLTNASDGAALIGSLQKDEDRQAFAHGIVMTLATLGVAPVDIVTAGALRRWPVLHMITSTALMAFVLGGMGVGIHISRMYLITQKYQTPHQILGLLVIVALFLVAIMGIYGRLIVKSAGRTGNPPPAWSGVLGKAHRWVGRGMWVIMLINVGLGLQFSEANKMLIIGYAVVAAGALVLVALIRWTVHCCTKHRHEDEEEDKRAFELSQIYGSGH